jgi:hypothetical protein
VCGRRSDAGTYDVKRSTSADRLLPLLRRGWRLADGITPAYAHAGIIEGPMTSQQRRSIVLRHRAATAMCIRPTQSFISAGGREAASGEVNQLTQQGIRVVVNCFCNRLVSIRRRRRRWWPKLISIIDDETVVGRVAVLFNE